MGAHRPGTAGMGYPPRPMLLAIDVGNTNIVYGLFDGRAARPPVPRRERARAHGGRVRRAAPRAARRCTASQPSAVDAARSSRASCLAHRADGAARAAARSGARRSSSARASARGWPSSTRTRARSAPTASPTPSRATSGPRAASSSSTSAPRRTSTASRPRASTSAACSRPACRSAPTPSSPAPRSCRASRSRSRPQGRRQNTVHSMQSGIVYGYVGLVDGLVERHPRRARLPLRGHRDGRPRAAHRAAVAHDQRGGRPPHADGAAHPPRAQPRVSRSAVRATPRALLRRGARWSAVALGVSFGSGSAALGDLFVSGAHGPRESSSTYRLPRVLLGAVAGAGLAAVGASFQSVLRNPLAEPYVLGVSGGAALGATLALAAGLAGATLLRRGGRPGRRVRRRARRDGASSGRWRASGRGGGDVDPARGRRRQRDRRRVRSRRRGLSRAGPRAVARVVAHGIPRRAVVGPARLRVALRRGRPGVLLVDAARMNVLSLGDEPAAALGVDVRGPRAARVPRVRRGGRRDRRASRASSASWASSCRTRCAAVIGPDLRVLLPASALAGGATLVTCDLLVRLASRVLHGELPVGALTALAGGPVFLAFLLRRAPG